MGGEKAAAVELLLGFVKTVDGIDGGIEELTKGYWDLDLMTCHESGELY